MVVIECSNNKYAAELSRSVKSAHLRKLDFHEIFLCYLKLFAIKFVTLR